MYSDKKVTKDGFVRYSFTHKTVLGLEEESGKVEKHACGSAGSSTTVTLVAVSILLRADRGGADISSSRRDYNEYCGLD